jgi:dihydroorotate dehydrogenase electron transfer subunit
VLPLGNGFSIPCDDIAGHTNSPSPVTLHPSPLLVGGGVGVAPLLYLGKTLKDRGLEPTFLLGARSAKDLLMLSEFEKYGRVLVTTEDGSMGEQGFVTNHSVLQQEHFDMIQVCGPTPMMKAVARYAKEKGIACEVSLENLMACGLGACLCCVEKVKADADASDTVAGHSSDAVATNVCVCKEGPVFNINRLLWQN